MQNGRGKKIGRKKKLGFRRITIDFGFTTKEISLPLCTSPCKRFSFVKQINMLQQKGF